MVLIMQLMRVVIAWGGGVRAKVSSETSLRSARDTQFPFITRFRLLAWMEEAYIIYSDVTLPKSPQKICTSVSLNRSSRCVYFLEPGQ